MTATGYKGKEGDHSGYFEWQLEGSNAEFWRRIGMIDLRGRHVLDLGCGHGALSIDAAKQGASSVVGIDISEERVEFAMRNLQANYPQFSSCVSFSTQPLDQIKSEYDFVLSKDAFEHMEDLPSILQAIVGALKPGGRLLAGFGPLYYSPFGDHGRYWGRKGVPWLPAVLPEPLLFALARKRTGKPVRRSMDVGLNKLTASEFRKIIAEQGWVVDSITYNAGNKRGMAAMRTLRKVPFLERYFTTSIYAVLRKR